MVPTLVENSIFICVVVFIVEVEMFSYICRIVRVCTFVFGVCGYESHYIGNEMVA